ncbi:WD40 repeat-like protein [Meira miltonrushii]|uniref:WD40 repeat-like protein n=1 Tax=Meira miltonrushii TaxID=1280837 RepID=A0A316V797_9BASI|nr:WD40 repeat-like protein [Meira miltonrushii]PWN33396.1 WD40 repeat-like protein [Meira miltonrushii]
MMMRTPPLASPSSSDSFARTTILSSSGPSTPTKAWRGAVHSLHHAFDDSSDEESDELFGSRPILAKTKQSQPSPSRFIIKGTVTPSRAAPLFARFSKDRRAAQRSKKRATDWSDSEEESNDEENIDRRTNISPWTPTKLTPRSKAQKRFPLTDISPSKSKHQRSSSNLTSSPIKPPAINVSQSRFIAASYRNAQPPAMPVPVPLSHRAGLVTTNMASYMHAMRSNNLGHLAFATSSRGNTLGSLGRGVLSVAGRLGGGGSGRMCNFSQRAFHSSFYTTSTPSLDLFTLPSEHDTHQFSHPICGEYANSSRSLSGQQAQWLAVGSNEGRVFLLNTLEGAMSEDDGSTPSWLAHDGSIFEVKWRPDDEMIATGGSDYQIRVWNTSTGEQIRSFSGHRGTPRSISWDPNGNGNILCSGGRDGAIHLYDLRDPSSTSEDDDGNDSTPPIASIWGAHTTEPVRPLKGPGSRGGRRGTQGRATYPKGITSLTYVPGRGSNILCSAGCGDGIVKLWDLRAMASYDDINMRDQMEETLMGINDPLEAGLDVSLQFTKNKSPHGISSIVASSTKIFTACTDGCIYTLPLYDLKARSTTDLGLPIGPMFDPAQRGNSLYARLALHDDERTLALGCSSGAVSVWDTHAASKAAAELSSLGVHIADLQPNGAKRQSSSLSPASEDPDFNFQSNVSIYGQGQEELIEMAKPAILHGAHRNNFEINGISWAHGPNGPTLASISDDHTIRTWSASQN